LAAELRFHEIDIYDYLHTMPNGAERVGRYSAEELAGHALLLGSRGIGTDAP